MSLVLYETDGQIGIITLNRPKMHNCMNVAMIKELDQVLDNVDLKTIRCLIITGAGNAFSSGSDINELVKLNSRQAMEYSEMGNDVFQKIGEFPIPTIAAINGIALGGGDELSLSCDIRICSDNAIFGYPETGLGITPGFGGTQRLAHYVSQGMAKQIIFTAQPIDAKEAYDQKLVNAVYKQEELMPAAKKLAKQIIANAPIAVRKSKEAINEARYSTIDEGKIYEEKCFGECFNTHDQVEGMSAFLEKRKEKVFTNN